MLQFYINNGLKVHAAFYFFRILPTKPKISCLGLIYQILEKLNFRKPIFVCYSYRSASIGLSWPAFMAGYIPAAMPVIIQMPIPAPIHTQGIIN